MATLAAAVLLGRKCKREKALNPVVVSPPGPLACNCTVTVLDCAKEHNKSAAAAAAASAAGRDPVAAAKAAQRRVWLSPKDALTMPAVSCATNDATTVMRIFYGANMAPQLVSHGTKREQTVPEGTIMGGNRCPHARAYAGLSVCPRPQRPRGSAREEPFGEGMAPCRTPPPAQERSALHEGLRGAAAHNRQCGGAGMTVAARPEPGWRRGRWARGLGVSAGAGGSSASSAQQL